VGGSTYLDEAGQTTFVSDPPDGSSVVRCDATESTETATGGNGFASHDETSESSSMAFFVSATPTPGAANTGCP